MNEKVRIKMASKIIPIKISLDNGCLNAKKGHPILNQINALEKAKKIRLFTASTTWREQIDTQKSPYWLKKYLKRISELEMVMEAGTVDLSRIGKARVVDTQTVEHIKKISFICFPGKKWEQITPNQKNDVLSLEAHHAFKFDYFLTLNPKDMINDGKAEKLKELDIVVREPNQDFLTEIMNKICPLK